MGSEDGSLSFPRFLVRLSLAYLGSFLAAGTLGSWSSFADLLTQAGVFADSSCSGFAVGKCVSQNERMQLLYYVAMAAQNVFAIPSGMLYDYTGPKFTSMIGLGLAVLGVAGCFVALQIPSAELILWLCVPLLELGQNIASWGVFGFIFYYKQHVGLITGICNSSFLLSSLMMYIVVAIVARGVLLKFGILFLLATTLLSCLLTIVSVPSLHEYQLSYLRTFGQHPQPRRSFRIIFMQLFQVFGLRKWQTLAYFAASAATNISFAFWMGSVYQFNNFNLGESSSDILASASAIMYAIIGVLASPLTGFLFDKLGILKYCAIFLSVQTAATLLVWPAALSVQFIVSILMFFLYSLWLTFESKSPAVFAPPDLYGSYLGFSNSLTGVLQLVLNLVIPVAIGDSIRGKWLYLLPVIVLMETGVFFLFVFIISLLVSPAPNEPPNLSDEQVIQ